jgi:hypothetical protein
MITIGIISGVKNIIAKHFIDTTLKDAVSYAVSPITYDMEMLKIASDRIGIIKDVNFLCGDSGDLRFQRANSLIAENATKGGFSVVVQGSEKDSLRNLKTGKKTNKVKGSNYAQDIIDDFLRRTKLNVFCTEHAAALVREGDIFLNISVDYKNKRIERIKRAPVLTMKRNTDEFGNFKNPERAFSQIDPGTDLYSFISSDAPRNSRRDFALYQINHIRWLSDETKLYGTSQYAASRKVYRRLEEMEKALCYRRMYRSVSKRAHKLDRIVSPSELQEYKRVNDMVDQNGNPTPNAHLLTDFIGNVDITALKDEANLDEVKDLEYMENLLWINLLVPKTIITGGQNINRDVLKVQYPHYLDSLNTITDRLEYGDSIYSGYRSIIDLELLLAGINPDEIRYDMVWSMKTPESLSDRLETVQNALGKGGGTPIITIEKAVQLIANDFDIEDPKEMYRELMCRGCK